MLKYFQTHRSFAFITNKAFTRVIYDNNFDACQCLIDAGFVCDPSLLTDAVKHDAYDIVRWFMERGLKPTTELLSYAVTNVNCKLTVKVLLEFGADPNAICYCSSRWWWHGNNEKMLPAAILASNFYAMHELLDKGVDQDSKNMALLTAIERGHVELAIVLLNCGAVGGVLDGRGHDALTYLCVSRYAREPYERQLTCKLAERLFIHNDVYLFHAIHAFNCGVLEKLLELGLDPNSDRNGTRRIRCLDFCQFAYGGESIQYDILIKWGGNLWKTVNAKKLLTRPLEKRYPPLSPAFKVSLSRFRQVWSPEYHQSLSQDSAAYEHVLLAGRHHQHLDDVPLELDYEMFELV